MLVSTLFQLSLLMAYHAAPQRCVLSFLFAVLGDCLLTAHDRFVDSQILGLSRHARLAGPRIFRPASVFTSSRYKFISQPTQPAVFSTSLYVIYQFFGYYLVQLRAVDSYAAISHKASSSFPVRALGQTASLSYVEFKLNQAWQESILISKCRGFSHRHGALLFK